MGQYFLIVLVGFLMFYFIYTNREKLGSWGPQKPQNPDIYTGPALVRMFYGRAQRGGVLSLDKDVMRLTVFLEVPAATLEQAATEGQWLRADNLEITCRAGTMEVLKFRDLSRLP